MVVVIVVLAVLTAVACVGVVYVVIHDRPRGTTPTDGATGLQVAGVVMMVLFPLGGFIAGCILLSRRPLQGTLIMVISAGMAFGYVSWALA